MYYLTTAPRNVEDISANGSVRGPSYHYQGNPVIPSNNTNKFESDELDPLPQNLQVNSSNTDYTNPNSELYGNRPTFAPYYLFFALVVNLLVIFNLNLQDIWMKKV